MIINQTGFKTQADREHVVEVLLKEAEGLLDMLANGEMIYNNSWSYFAGQIYILIYYARYFLNLDGREFARYTYFEDIGPNHPHCEMHVDIPIEKADLSIPHEVVIY